MKWITGWLLKHNMLKSLWLFQTNDCVHTLSRTLPHCMAHSSGLLSDSLPVGVTQSNKPNYSHAPDYHTGTFKCHVTLERI